MHYRHTITSVALALALAVPSAALAQSGTDLRSPDTRDAAAGVTGPSSVQDLRSPDARDAAIQTSSLAGTTSETNAVPAVETVVVDDGFEWGSAGIGAAAALAIVLALGAFAALVIPRRRTRSPIPH